MSEIEVSLDAGGGDYRDACGALLLTLTQVPVHGVYRGGDQRRRDRSENSSWRATYEEADSNACQIAGDFRSALQECAETLILIGCTTLVHLVPYELRYRHLGRSSLHRSR
jgi:hypothetical protein